jgi:SEC-C motif
VSDHPVTVYNAAAPPTAVECEYPDDPPSEWVGTQTVFALDANTCLILTHLEYAQAPNEVDLTAARTHARYRGQSLTRTEAFIRCRELLRDEVVAINHLLKQRARRFVAASNVEWLYPERSLSGTWQGLAEVLLPRDELWQFGGEIVVGYKDGSTRYQDSFGRTSRAHEYLRKKSRAGLGPNDDCGCGSGRKFKHCCEDLPLTERPTWDLYGIRERNLMFSHAVKDILGLNSGKTWDDVRRDLNSKQVERIHEAFGGLWPEDTDLSALLPRPRNGRLRVLYLGVSDPRTVEATVFGWLPYFDEIVLAHPFINPLRIKPEYSPTASPAKHKAQTLKNVLLLLLLEPYIHSGYVHLIPCPSDFNTQFGTTMLQMARHRAEDWKPDRKSVGSLNAIVEDDYRRVLRQMPESFLRSSMRQHSPDASDADINAAITYIKSELAEDPCALLQPIEPGEAGAQFLCSKGYSLESAMYLASLTASTIYTDVEAHWQQLHIYAQQDNRGQNAAWVPVVDSLRSVELPIETDRQLLYEGLQAGHFGSVRGVFRRLAEALQQQRVTAQTHQIARDLSKSTSAMQGERVKAQSDLRLVGRIELSVPIGGFQRNEVRRLLLTFGKAKAPHPIPFAMFIRVCGGGEQIVGPFVAVHDSIIV